MVRLNVGHAASGNFGQMAWLPYANPGAGQRVYSMWLAGRAWSISAAGRGTPQHTRRDP